MKLRTAASEVSTKPQRRRDEADLLPGVVSIGVRGERQLLGLDRADVPPDAVEVPIDSEAVSFVRDNDLPATGANCVPAATETNWLRPAPQKNWPLPLPARCRRGVVQPAHRQIGVERGDTVGPVLSVRASAERSSEDFYEESAVKSKLSFSPLYVRRTPTNQKRRFSAPLVARVMPPKRTSPSGKTRHLSLTRALSVLGND
jgi:hypothetical protein